MLKKLIQFYKIANSGIFPSQKAKSFYLCGGKAQTDLKLYDEEIEWGYEGGGPRSFSKQILEYWFDEEIANKHYAAFTEDTICNIPLIGGKIRYQQAIFCVNDNEDIDTIIRNEDLSKKGKRKIIQCYRNMSCIPVEENGTGIYELEGFYGTGWGRKGWPIEEFSYLILDYWFGLDVAIKFKDVFIQDVLKELESPLTLRYENIKNWLYGKKTSRHLLNKETIRYKDNLPLYL